MHATRFFRQPLVWATGALCVLIAAIWWKDGATATEAVPSPEVVVVAADPEATAPAVMSPSQPVSVPSDTRENVSPRVSLAPQTLAPATQVGDDRPREWVEIEAAVVTYSATALPALAKYLTHADPAVREAARDGFLQMGLGEGAAYLREAADKVRDPREAVQLLDAADFLDLPVLPVKAGPGARPASPATRERLERERAAVEQGAAR